MLKLDKETGLFRKILVSNMSISSYNHICSYLHENIYYAIESPQKMKTLKSNQIQKHDCILTYNVQVSICQQ